MLKLNWTSEAWTLWRFAMDETQGTDLDLYWRQHAHTHTHIHTHTHTVPWVSLAAPVCSLTCALFDLSVFLYLSKLCFVDSCLLNTSWVNKQNDYNEQIDIKHLRYCRNNNKSVSYSVWNFVSSWHWPYFCSKAKGSNSNQNHCSVFLKHTHASLSLKHTNLTRL